MESQPDELAKIVYSSMEKLETWIREVRISKTTFDEADPVKLTMAWLVTHFAAVGNFAAVDDFGNKRVAWTMPRSLEDAAEYKCTCDRVDDMDNFSHDELDGSVFAELRIRVEDGWQLHAMVLVGTDSVEPSFVCLETPILSFIDEDTVAHGDFSWAELAGRYRTEREASNTRLEIKRNEDVAPTEGLAAVWNAADVNRLKTDLAVLMEVLRLSAPSVVGPLHPSRVAPGQKKWHTIAMDLF